VEHSFAIIVGVEEPSNFVGEMKSSGDRKDDFVLSFAAAS
jgi:hypothetical protein